MAQDGNKQRPILVLDFDGVLHSYTSGWQGADNIPDPPVAGMWEFLEEAKHHFDIQVFSSRSHQTGGVEAMMAWLVRTRREWRAAHGMHDGDEPLSISFPTEKPPAMITIDDRAITFTGEWPSIEALKAFVPWNKRTPPAR